jgi:hypothetical protein
MSVETVIRMRTACRFNSGIWGVAEGWVVGESLGKAVWVIGVAVGLEVAWGLGEGFDVASVTVQLYIEVKPALSMYWTVTVFTPALSCRVQVFDATYDSQFENSLPPLENRICPTPETSSVAVKNSVIVGV